MGIIGKDLFSERLAAMNSHWKRYLLEGKFERSIEFIVAVNSLVDSFNRLHMSGLVRLCEELECEAFAKLSNESAHPISSEDQESIQKKIDTLNGMVESMSLSPASRRHQDKERNRVYFETEGDPWIKPRHILVVADNHGFDVANELKEQLSFFGFKIEIIAWEDQSAIHSAPLAVIFMGVNIDSAEQLALIAHFRQQFFSSQMLYLGEPLEPEPIVKLMRAGVDATIPIKNQSTMVLSRILDLVKAAPQEKSHVLVVEDSRVALASIERALAQYDIDTFSINSPDKLFDALEIYRPDLILMDMHMPKFNGVEATRVLRQTEDYATIPIVYLSADSEVSLQVEALRLGGDQFLMKPFNPVLLAAVVEAKISRFREMQRSTQVDGLTGLLNHASSKIKLAAMLRDLSLDQEMAVVMLNIDQFKSINDAYGHPVGDLVIRTLAYLLKGRLRSIDLIGRYGGEKYIIGLPGVDARQAAVIIDKIRQDFARFTHHFAGGVIHATFSAGTASYPNLGSVSELIEAADNALLQAKRLGRNRVEHHQSE
ncbi:MAG: diguanylate cyclase [Methylotenera sp.]|uniref:GGDEF domain-containing response regulator n=1 Tax=Methylotenera sp. TaxID=2051956 RepID=UPI00248A5F44|nr:diguanylate cyclase [Methylotenera sp.]MDI1310232.1 diguanylate cyclase [Methylotenera sp.]